eukprot:UN06605
MQKKVEQGRHKQGEEDYLGRLKDIEKSGLFNSKMTGPEKRANKIADLKSKWGDIFVKLHVTEDLSKNPNETNDIFWSMFRLQVHNLKSQKDQGKNMAIDKRLQDLRNELDSLELERSGLETSIQDKYVKGSPSDNKKNNTKSDPTKKEDKTKNDDEDKKIDDTSSTVSSFSSRTRSTRQSRRTLSTVGSSVSVRPNREHDSGIKQYFKMEKDQNGIVALKKWTYNPNGNSWIPIPELDR